MGGFCGDSQKQGQQSSNATQWVDPLGPSSINANGSQTYSATGAPQQRTQLFNYLSSYLPQMTQAGSNYAAALGKAASAPGWGAAADNASRTAAGDYLNGSPELDRAMAWNRATTLSDAANENARIRSRFAQNGMDFSTGNEQAEQANNAAANASAANTSAQTYLQNYLSERANQNNAGQMLASAQAGPLSYLASVPGAYTGALTPAANLLSGLSSGGQVLTLGTNTTGTASSNPSLGSDIMTGVSAL